MMQVLGEHLAQLTIGAIVFDDVIEGGWLAVEPMPMHDPFVSGHQHAPLLISGLHDEGVC